MQQRGGVLGCVPDADKGPVAQLPPPAAAHCVLQRCSLRCSSYFCAAALPLCCSALCCSGALFQLGSQQSLHCAAVMTRFNCIRGGQWADCCRRATQIHDHCKYNSNACSVRKQFKPNEKEQNKRGEKSSCVSGNFQVKMRHDVPLHLKFKILECGTPLPRAVQCALVATNSKDKPPNQ